MIFSLEEEPTGAWFYWSYMDSVRKIHFCKQIHKYLRKIYRISRKVTYNDDGLFNVRYTQTVRLLKSTGQQKNTIKGGEKNPFRLKIRTGYLRIGSHVCEGHEAVLQYRGI